MSIEPTTMSRRELLELLAAGSFAAVLGACRPTAQTGVRSAPRALTDDIYSSSVTALASAIRDGRVSSEDVVKACLARIEEVNPKLNAVVQLAAEEALRGARAADEKLARGEEPGPLHGVPMTIKDSLDTAGVISTGGSTGRAKFVPAEDATVVARLRAAGAILLGKTNTPELTLSYETENLIYGRTNNPYDLTRTSGGSSGGAAAIIAAGGSPFDIGSDYGGSIRLPSHCCGIAGIKPTSGRVPRTGHIIPFGGPLDSFQQLGPMARHVEDLGLILGVIAGPDWIDPAIVPMPLEPAGSVKLGELRVSFHTDNGIQAPTPETVRVVESAAEALSSHVLSVKEARPTGIEESFEIITALWDADGGAGAKRLLLEAGTEQISLGWLEELEPLSAPDLDALHARWVRFRSRMLSFLQDFDVILSPVNARPAMPHGLSAEHFTSFSYTMTHNLTGWPSAVVRGGTSPEQLPIGVQIVARPWCEHVALAVAEHLETALGGYHRPTL